MGKAEMAQWLLKRIGTKVDDLRYSETEEIAHILADDIDTYIGMLKDIVVEVIKP
jgi:hypothetical protein